MEKNKHLIGKVFLEIDTNSMKVANSLKNNINMFIKNELLTLIEQELDGFILDENQILQIEKLDLSIDEIKFQNDSISSDTLKEEIKKQLFQKLEFAKINSGISKNNDATTHQVLSETEKKINTLIYYLTNGEMPWWVSKNDNKVIFDQNLDICINSENFKYQIQNIFDKTIVQKRLIYQFSNKQLAQITAIVSSITIHKSSSQENKIIDNLNKENNSQLKELFWTAIFQYCKDKNTATITNFYFRDIKKFKSRNMTFEDFISNLKQFVPIKHFQIDASAIPNQMNISTEKIETPPMEILETDPSDFKKIHYDQIKISETNNSDFEKAYYVQNAGLIIIHPFIKELFKNCNLIKEGNALVDKELAAHILHYVATKKEQDYEHAMLFEKFLCGIPIQQPIHREINIEDTHKQQVEEMLQSVLEHWTALKSSSIDLLRNEFLQREGKLDIQDKNPRIFIEKKTQDLLLEKIPWNISVSKIPWIEKLIYTDW